MDGQMQWSLVSEGGVHSPMHLAFTVAAFSPDPKQSLKAALVGRKVTCCPKPGREGGHQASGERRTLPTWEVPPARWPVSGAL